MMGSRCLYWLVVWKQQKYVWSQESLSFRYVISEKEMILYSKSDRSDLNLRNKWIYVNNDKNNITRRN